MGGKLVRAAAEHAEDFALSIGALLLAGGLGWKVGWWAALVALGFGLLILGTWISARAVVPHPEAPREDEGGA